jgi:hypothetical protein
MTIFGVDWSELKLEHVAAFLEEAGREYLTCEAGGAMLRAHEVRRHICGFVNSRAGGYLILGAEQDNGSWRLDGVEFPDEPAVWVGEVVAHDQLRPYPRELDVRAWPTGAGRQVAVIWCPPAYGLTCRVWGTLYERVGGKTISVLIDKSERNEFFLAIQKAGFDPRNFIVEHDEHHWLLTHRSRGHRCELIKEGSTSTGDLRLRAERKVGDVEFQEIVGGSGIGSLALHLWLREIREFQNEPKPWQHDLDLWAKIDNESPIADLMEDQENTPFTAQEQQRIAETVAGVIQQAREAYELSEEQLRLLEAKLDYVVDVARRSWRIDWLNIAVGTVGGAFAGGVLTPEVVQKVLGALGAGLGSLFGHPTSMLGP